MNNIAIIGSGSFGCAIANHLSNKENNIKIWSYKNEEKDYINNMHKCYFIRDIELNKNIKAYSNFNEVLDNAEYVFIITPADSVRSVIKNMKEYVDNKKIILCSKGLELDSNKLLIDVIKEELENEIGILSGPSIARDILNKKKTTIVFASNNDKYNEEIKQLMEDENLKIKTSNDVIGVQIGGAFKNIGAIAYGMAEIIDSGILKKSTIIENIINEIKIIGKCLGAKEETFDGPSCYDDLLVTCNSKESRNHKAGILLAQGKKVDEIKEEIGMVVEGFDSLKIAYNIGKKNNLNLKLINELYKSIFEN